MSPAGAGVAHFRNAPRPAPFIGAGLLVGAFVALAFLLSSGSPAHASTPAPVAALSPAWSEFQTDCTAGPAPGQGSTPQACVCWEGQLQAAAILPGYAVDALDAAQVGGGPSYTVGENLAGGPVGSAMASCGL